MPPLKHQVLNPKAFSDLANNNNHNRHFSSSNNRSNQSKPHSQLSLFNHSHKSNNNNRNPNCNNNSNHNRLHLRPNFSCLCSNHSLRKCRHSQRSSSSSYKCQHQMQARPCWPIRVATPS